MIFVLPISYEVSVNDIIFSFFMVIYVLRYTPVFMKCQNIGTVFWVTVGTRPVFHIKRDQNGKAARLKVRIVAQGFAQVPGQDFTLTFDPVVRWDAIRFVMCIAAIHDLELRHIDVKTAFLNGVLDEEIYVKKPEALGQGFWRLKKGLSKT